MPCRARCIPLAAAALLALGAPVARSGAQAVLVRAVDAASGRALADAVVALIDSAGVVQAEAATDPAGRRLLRAPAAGVFRVSVRHAGFAPLTSAAITLADTGTVSVELRGHAAAGPGGAATPTAASAGVSRGEQYRTEFDARRRLGMGYVVTAREVRDAAGLRPVFESVPALVVQPDGRSAVDFRVMMRGGGLERVCAPNIWVDGMRGTQEMLASINTADVLGIEVYRRFGSAPAAYQSGSSRCGVILIWTSYPS